MCMSKKPENDNDRLDAMKEFLKIIQNRDKKKDSKSSFDPIGIDMYLYILICMFAQVV